MPPARRAMASGAPQEDQAYLDRRGQQHQLGAVDPHRHVLHRPLLGAVDAGRLSANRLLRSRAVRRPKAIRENDEITIEVPTHAEVNRILDALPPAWQPFFLTLACTGMRYGEAVALTWNDLEEASGRLWVRRSYYRGEYFMPKTKHSRRAVDIGDQLVAVLQGARRARYGGAAAPKGR